MAVPLIDSPTGGGPAPDNSGRYHTMTNGGGGDGCNCDTHTSDPGGTAVIFRSSQGRKIILGPDDLIIALFVAQIVFTGYLALQK